MNLYVHYALGFKTFLTIFSFYTQQIFNSILAFTPIHFSRTLPLNQSEDKLFSQRLNLKTLNQRKKSFSPRSTIKEFRLVDLKETFSFNLKLQGSCIDPCNFPHTKFFFPSQTRKKCINPPPLSDCDIDGRVG